MFQFPIAVIRLSFSIVALIVILNNCTRDDIIEPTDDGLPPLIPTDLQIYSAFDGQIGLSWKKNNEYDLMGYRIYRSIGNSARFTLIGFTSETFYVDDSLEYEVMYNYKIRAVDIRDRESEATATVSAQPKNIYIPYRPQPISINARNWPSQFGIKLVWAPPIDKDLKGYEIYRSTVKEFQPDSSNLHDFSESNIYVDSKDIKLLAEYFYKVRAVDKGNLKSQFTDLGSDLILDLPVPSYPTNNSFLNTITEFKFITCSKPAKYKLVISYEAYGVVKEYIIYSEKTNTEISIPAQGFYYDAYRTYSWKIYTFTTSETDPNSMSQEFLFTLKP